jgi:YbbR domain-containing protein
MRNAFRWLLGNLGLILLSLTLAVLVWVVAVEQENPTLERRFPVPIPVTVSAPPEGLVAYDQSADQVYVTVRAPRSVWDVLQVTDLRATVSLNGLGEGLHQVAVRVDVARQPASVRLVEPESIDVHLEPQVAAALPVEARLEGSTALGYTARLPVVRPVSATVQGPASLVAQVTELVARVSVEGGRVDVEGEFELEPRDDGGEIIAYVTVSPATVSVYVPVEQLSGFRDRPVTALLEGQVAPGYRISSVRVDPPVVTVYGTPDAISLLPGYLQTAPLNLEGAQGDVEVQLPLQTPEGVSILEPVVTVRVTIVPLEGSVTISRTVEIQRTPPGMTATVAPETVEVILSGPLPVLQELRETDVRVIVDLFGLTAGSHSVEPQVVVPPDLVYEAILPTTLQVEIVSLATPTRGR